MDLSYSVIQSLVSKIDAGKTVLFLGSGINKGCFNQDCEEAPVGEELALAIRNKFFPDEHTLPPDLRLVSELVIRRECRPVLQHFIYTYLQSFTPHESALRLLPQFPWKRIYTTNFDVLLEKIYQSEQGNQYSLQPIYSHMTQIDDTFPNSIQYYKLHGCISQISSEPGLTLTRPDYENSRVVRETLFSRLESDLRDGTLLFVGYSMRDSNFEELFFSIQRKVGHENFPRCFSIDPCAPDYLKELWDDKRVHIITQTALKFFQTLTDREVSDSGLEKPPEDEAIISLFPTIDLNLRRDLEISYDMITPDIGNDECDPASFFQGDPPTWSIIRENCDAERDFFEVIMDEILLVPEEERTAPVEICVITAEAGSGKTTLLKRLAFDHSNLFEGFCLNHRSFQRLRFETIEEVSRHLNKKRVFIYIDDAADYILDVADIAHRARAQSLPLTLVLAERKNEWNVIEDRLSAFNIIEYGLRSLSEMEIKRILETLESNNYLCELSDLNYDERFSLFSTRAEKQLLVAMREATEGKDFDRIIQDEFDAIPSDLGKKTYLNVCSLHRFGIPVRAGLLKRMAGVSFEEFQKELLKPCEKVIVTEKDPRSGDFLYRARHPFIAEIVCKYKFRDPEDISETYISILDVMDLGYSTDMASFSELVKADELVDSLQSLEHRRFFYSKAASISQNAAFVDQHRGIMEMRHNNIEEAESFIRSACKKEPSNPVFQHSFARVLARKGEIAANAPQKHRYIEESQEVLRSLMRSTPRNPYAYDSYARNVMESAKKADDITRRESLEEAFDTIQNGIQKCNDNAHLLTTAATILEELGDDKAALQNLETAHSVNPTNMRTGLLLASFLEARGEIRRALDVVEECLKYSPLNEQGNLLAANLLRKSNPNDHDSIRSFLRRCVDKTYRSTEANFLYGVHSFKAGSYDEAKEIFDGFKQRKSLVRSNMSYALRELWFDEFGKPKEFEGTIKHQVRDKSSFINADLCPLDVFLKGHGLDKRISVGTRVKFQIGFNFFGPTATQVTII